MLRSARDCRHLAHIFEHRTEPKASIDKLNEKLSMYTWLIDREAGGHFADKQGLLAAVAARELSEFAGSVALGANRAGSPGAALEAVMLAYVAWSLQHPQRFMLVFGSWSTESPELTEQAEASWGFLVQAVAAAQESGELPAQEDPERLTALIRATAHGAVALALAGHLSAEGKGHADPADLLHDLFAHMRVQHR
jgi:AcrR family transcriptional regulator